MASVTKTDLKEALKEQGEKIRQERKVDLNQQDKKFDKRIDTLAVMVKKGFDDVDKRFDKMEGEMKGMRVDIDKLFGKVNGLTRRIDVLALNQGETRDKLEKLYKEVTFIREMIGKQNFDHARLQRLEKRVTLLEKNVLQ